MSAVKQDAKKLYRVVAVGATYYEPTPGLAPDGSEVTLQVYKVGRFGDAIELTDKQAARLLDLEVVVPAEAPHSYQEMTVDDLKAKADEAGLQVTGSGANGAVLKEDLVNALNTYDQGARS